jgi:hypothetical protein
MTAIGQKTQDGGPGMKRIHRAVIVGLISLLLGELSIAAILGDINGDDTVNSIDWSIMSSDWGTANPRSDLNKDGTVDQLDYAILLSNWGKTEATSLTLSPEQPVHGVPFLVTWTGNTNIDFYGRLRLHILQTAHDEFIIEQIVRPLGQSGSALFTVPLWVVPGTYELRLYNSRLPIATSLPFTIGNPSRTVNFLVKSGGAEFRKNDLRLRWGGRGINIAAIDPASGELVRPIVKFDTWGQGVVALDAMLKFLNTVPDGVLLLLAVGDEAGAARTEAGYPIFEAMGSLLIRQVGFRDAWAMMTIKGSGKAIQEKMDIQPRFLWGSVTIEAQFVFPLS